MQQLRYPFTILLSLPQSLVGFLRVPVKVDGIPEIDTGQNGENVLLNKCDAYLQYLDRDAKGEREPADQQRQRERHAEQHGQYRVARRHVGEEPDRQGEGASQVADNLNWHHQRKQQASSSRVDMNVRKLQNPINNDPDYT